MIEVVGKFVFGNKSNRTGAIRFRVVFFSIRVWALFPEYIKDVPAVWHAYIKGDFWVES